MDIARLFWARPTGHDVETAPGVRLELSARSHFTTRGSVGLREMDGLWLVPVNQDMQWDSSSAMSNEVTKDSNNWSIALS